MNRRYRKPNKRHIPTIWHLKDMIYQQQMQQGVFAFLDLHGHSRKMSIFMYGCKEFSKLPVYDHIGKGSAQEVSGCTVEQSPCLMGVA